MTPRTFTSRFGYTWELKFHHCINGDIRTDSLLNINYDWTIVIGYLELGGWTQVIYMHPRGNYSNFIADYLFKVFVGKL